MELGERVAGWLRASWWRSVLWTVACLMSTTMAVAVGEPRSERAAGQVPDELASGWWLLLWLVGILLIVLLWWRRRWPWQITVVASVVTLATPLDPLVALVALMQVWIRSGWVAIASCTALVTGATFAATWRDTRGESALESFWWTLFAGEDQEAVRGSFAWWVPVVITVLAVALFAGVGALRRELSRTRATGEGHRVVATQLADEVVRQAERERIAREVHDVIGHRLSLLSIHAGALEAHTRDDDRLAGSATLVRESAAQTATDLRSLLEVLRRPDDPDLAEAVPGLEAVPALVDETVAHGMPLVATVVVDGAASLDPLLGQTAYRVIQELLTNARRHAPGAGVRLLVTARPDLGVTIEAANRRAESRPLVEGNGLTGLRERVAHVGGEALVRVDEEGVLRVAVRLPWRFAPTTEEVPR